MNNNFTLNLDNVLPWRREAIKQELADIVNDAALDSTLFDRVLAIVPSSTEDEERDLANSLIDTVRAYIRDVELRGAILDIFHESYSKDAGKLKEVTELLDAVFQTDK